MSFHEVKFPSEISKKAAGGPVFQTAVTQLASGKEQRNVNWQNARAKYVISIKSLSEIDSKKLLEFFYARQGAAYGFRFKDWLDFEAQNQILGTGNNIKTSFDLVKNYINTTINNLNINYARRISKPVQNTVSVFVNSIKITSGFTINYENGTINFSTPPITDAVISANFQFDVPVRFAADELKIAYENIANNSAKEIELIEVKL
jgi:uncharacterized protein (TIGR02217 family)